MTTITFVTTSNGKYEAAKHVMDRYGIDLIRENISLPESQDDSLDTIAIDKAKYAYNLVKQPLLTMDAGFFIPSLNGFPGIFTHYVLDTIGISGLLTLTKGENVHGEFREALCYFESPDKKPQLFYRIVKGTLSDRARGEMRPHHWSELALVFVPEGKTKTMAEMTEEEFGAFRKEVDSNSHFEQFAKFLTE